MYSSHQCADQSFDMAAVVRATNWAPIQLNSPLRAPARERFGFKFLCVVGMELLGQAPDRPLGFDASRVEPVVFGEAGLS